MDQGIHENELYEWCYKTVLKKDNKEFHEFIGKFPSPFKYFVNSLKN